MKIYQFLSRAMELRNTILFLENPRFMQIMKRSAQSLEFLSARLHVSHEKANPIPKKVNATWNPYKL